MELRGIEPRTSHMRSEHSTSELQPRYTMERFKYIYICQIVAIQFQGNLEQIGFHSNVPLADLIEKN